MKTLVKNIRAIDPALGFDEVCDILIEGEQIVEVGQDLSADGAEVLDRTGCIVVPGLVDVHVHLRDPGQEYKETIETGTAAAAHGGFTGICSMPNTTPTTDNAATIDYVLDRAQSAGHCRVYPSGACTMGLKGESLAEIGDMAAHGAVAFTDDGRGVQSAGMMRRVMDYAKMFGCVVMSHCQDEELVGPGQVNEGVVSTRLGMAGWPGAGEELQIQRDIALSELTGCPIHIQHITTARGVDIVRQGKARNIKVTCEATPHHIVLNEDDLTSTYNTNLKMNPPLRTKADNDAIIEGIKDGTIDCIVTDHAPHAAHEKAREFELAPFGMTGLETSLGVVLTYLVRPGHIDYNRMVELMAIRPREILRIDQVQIKPGNVADLTIFDPEKKWIVNADDMCSKSKNSGFMGYELIGRTSDVFVGGTLTCKDGDIVE